MASASQNHDHEDLSTINDDIIDADTSDWNEVVIELMSLSAEWDKLAIHLGLTKHIIDRIKKDHPNDSNGCLNEALGEWIKQNYSTNKFGLPSWRTLLKAVKQVNNGLFRKLSPKYQLEADSSMRVPIRNPEISTSNTGSSPVVTSGTGMIGTGTVEVLSETARKFQLHSQDSAEKLLPKQRIPKRYDPPLFDHEMNQSTASAMSPKHSQVPISSVPHIESSVNTTAKSLGKKGALEGSQDQLYLRVSRSEASKHDRKHVHSFPGIRQSSSDKPNEEPYLTIDGTILLGFSLVMADHNSESFTQADRSRSSCQLYVPTNAEPITQLDRSRSRSSSYLCVSTNAESFTHPDRSRSSGQLYMSTNMTDSFIKFSLRFDRSRLIVRLKCAENLPEEFHKGIRCDPFVVLHLEPNREETFQSKVIKNTRDPEFGQTFRFEGISVECIKLQMLVLRIYNHALNNKTIGKVCFPLDEVVEVSGAVMRMKITCSEEMESNYQGDLLLSLEYDPVSHTLAGVVSRATCLTKHDIFGKSDPYVKVVVSHYDMIVHKFKTSVKNKTLAPVYNECFSYTVAEEMKIDKIAISLFVIDHDLAKWNDVIGVVNIGKNVATKLGREHWHQVLQSPRKEISFWHPVQLATSAQKRHMRSRGPSPTPV